MTTASRRLQALFDSQGWQGRVVPAGRLAELDDAVHGSRTRELLDEEFYGEALAPLRFEIPRTLPNARSILIVAVPVPRTRVVFHWGGDARAVTVPPTYAEYSARTARVQAALGALLERQGHRLASMTLPLKTLAVRSGLAAYGRNNIAYVTGMGSFLQLVGACTDLPCPDDPWREPRMLEQCGNCFACGQRCPTGAIARERFLLRTERCLTFHNERSADFPPWIDPSWHHCLVGCMRCQEICPENASVLGWVEDRGAFSEEETALLANRVPLERLPGPTAAKVRSLELNEPYPDLCRNLSMLVKQAAGAA